MKDAIHKNGEKVYSKGEYYKVERPVVFKRPFCDEVCKGSPVAQSAFNRFSEQSRNFFFGMPVNGFMRENNVVISHLSLKRQQKSASME